MKNYLIALCSFVALLSLSSCKKKKVYPDSSSYIASYILDLKKTIDANSVKTTFNPTGACLSDGKIYITNSDANRVEIVDAQTGVALDSIKKWTFNGVNEQLQQPTDVFVSNGRIYITSLSSYRVDVFDVKTLAFISCIGIGNYSGTNAILDPWAVRVKDNKVFVKTRDSYICVFNADDVTPENYKKVKIKAYLALQTTGFDNASYSMEFSGKYLYATDRYSKKIFSFDTDLIDLNNTQLALKANALQPNKEINLSDKSKNLTGLSVYKDSVLFISYDNNSNIDVLKNNEIVSSNQKVGGVSLNRPHRIFIANNTILISDKVNKALYFSTIEESVVKEFNSK